MTCLLARQAESRCMHCKLAGFFYQKLACLLECCSSCEGPNHDWRLGVPHSWRDICIVAFTERFTQLHMCRSSSLLKPAVLAKTLRHHMRGDCKRMQLPCSLLCDHASFHFAQIWSPPKSPRKSQGNSRQPSPCFHSLSS